MILRNECNKVLDVTLGAILLLAFVLGVTLGSCEVHAKWPPKKLMMDKANKVLKYTGLLGVEIGRAGSFDTYYIDFCSGVLAQDPKGKVKFWTAAHCCGPLIMRRIAPVIVVDNKKYQGQIVGLEDIDSQGKDLCGIPLKKVVISPIKVSPRETDADNSMIGDNYFMLITKFTTLDYDKQIAKVYRLGLFDLDISYDLVTALFAPGTSGSPIMDSKGNIIGAVGIGLLDATYPIGGIATYNNTQWFSNYDNELIPRVPLPGIRSTPYGDFRTMEGLNIKELNQH